MRHLKLTADDAYRYIKARRPHISPNFNFLGQLYEYERNLPTPSGASICSHFYTSSSPPPSTSFSIPLVKCITMEVTPLNERRRFLHLETSSSSNSFKREHNNDQPKAPPRPKGFNFDLINTHQSQSLLSPSSGIANLSVESPKPHASLPAKLLRPNSITLKRSSPTNEISSSTELLNTSHASEFSSITHKRVKTLPRSTESSPLSEKNDLINSYFEGAISLPRSNSTHSLDSTREPTNASPTNNSNKSQTNSLNSSRELLVS